MTHEHAERRAALRTEAERRGLEGVLAYSWRRSSVSWLTGYVPGYLSNSAVLWLPVDGEPVLGVRFGFDLPRAAASELKVVPAPTPLAVLPGTVTRIGLLAGDLAVDETPVRVSRELAERGVTVEDLTATVVAMQARKSPAEIERLRRAARIAAEALRAVSGHPVGATDFEIAGAVEGAARRLGSTRCLTLVGVGDGAVITEATGLRVGPLDPVGLEVTLYADGACMHVTATLPPAEVRPVDRRADEVCRATRHELMRAMVPGASVDEVVRRGDDVLRQHGLLECKEYDFGHGLGAETPEIPQLIESTGQVIAEDMVVSVHVGVRRARGETAVVGGPVLVTTGGAVELITGSTPWSP